MRGVELLDLLHLLHHLELVPDLRRENVHLLLPDAGERQGEAEVAEKRVRVERRVVRLLRRLYVLGVVNSDLAVIGRRGRRAKVAVGFVRLAEVGERDGDGGGGREVGLLRVDRATSSHSRTIK